MKTIHGKIGNMRKSVKWVMMTLNPYSVIIQSDNRIAKIDMKSHQAILSDGKGGHQGFHKLSEVAGAVQYPCPKEILEQITSHLEKQPHDGQPIVVVG